MKKSYHYSIIYLCCMAITSGQTASAETLFDGSPISPVFFSAVLKANDSSLVASRMLADRIRVLAQIKKDAGSGIPPMFSSLELLKESMGQKRTITYAKYLEMCSYEQYSFKTYSSGALEMRQNIDASINYYAELERLTSTPIINRSALFEQTLQNTIDREYISIYEEAYKAKRRQYIQEELNVFFENVKRSFVMAGSALGNFGNALAVGNSDLATSTKDFLANFPKSIKLKNTITIENAAEIQAALQALGELKDRVVSSAELAKSTSAQEDIKTDSIQASVESMIKALRRASDANIKFLQANDLLKTVADLDSAIVDYTKTQNILNSLKNFRPMPIHEQCTANMGSRAQRVMQMKYYSDLFNLFAASSKLISDSSKALDSIQKSGAFQFSGVALSRWVALGEAGLKSLNGFNEFMLQGETASLSARTTADMLGIDATWGRIDVLYAQMLAEYQTQCRKVIKPQFARTIPATPVTEMDPQYGACYQVSSAIQPIRPPSLPSVQVPPILAPTPATPWSSGYSGSVNLFLNKPVSVSSALAGGTPGAVVDGKPESVAVVGATTGTFDIDLGAPVTLSRMELTPAQSPAGPTVHALLVSRDGVSWTEVARLQGQTSNGVKIVYPFAQPLTGVRKVRVQTLSSPSWVGWMEIAGYGSADTVSAVSPGMPSTTPGLTLPLLTSSQAETPVHVNAPASFLLKGTNLTSAVLVSLQDCTNPRTTRVDAQTLRHECVPQQPGNKQLFWKEQAGGVEHSLGVYTVRSAVELATPTPAPTPLTSGNSGRVETNLFLNKPVSVSSPLAGGTPDAVVDGKPETAGLIGGFTGAFDIDLGTAATLSRVELTPMQNPAGATVHVLLVSRDGMSWTEVARLQGQTSNGVKIVYPFAQPLTGVRKVRVQTLSSPSWVGWMEIAGYGIANTGGMVNPPGATPVAPNPGTPSTNPGSTLIPAAPLLTSSQAETPVHVNAPASFLLKGTNLTPAVLVSLQDCANTRTTLVDTQTLRHQCVPQQPGNKQLFWKEQAGGVERPLAVYTVRAAVEVATPAPAPSPAPSPVAQPSNLSVSPLSAMVGDRVRFTVSGNNVPSSLVIDLAGEECLNNTKPAPNVVECMVRTSGTPKVLTVKDRPASQGGVAIWSGQVSVAGVPAVTAPAPVTLNIVQAAASPSMVQAGQLITFGVVVDNPSAVERVDLVFPDANLTEAMTQTAGNAWSRARPLSGVGVNRPFEIRVYKRGGGVLTRGGVFTVQAR